MIRWSQIVLCGLGILWSAGIAWGQNAEPLHVVTSFSLLEEVVKEIGGDAVKVENLSPRGVDLHDFQLKPQDHVRLKNAHLVVWLGLEYETWLESALKKIPDSQQLQVGASLTNLLPLAEETHEHGHSQHAHEHGEFDPHFWHDPHMMIQVTDIIKQALVKKLPAQAEGFASRAQVYSQKLSALHQDLQMQLSFIPAEQRILATTHEAFGYFGRAYQFQVLAIKGVTTHHEPTPKQFRALVKTLKQQKAQALFIEKGINPAAMQQLSRETKLPISGELTPENLAPSGQPGDHYESMMRRNIETIVKVFRERAS